ncbi:MAG: hypoxanthine-guanine phosphoribosyltransferase [Methylococcales bacterium]|jgi:hypoxanthine phosphoribosyltransferase|nr:hypoxanthine-guanine phosphoribosyltransferase [Methylococcales bacterium]MBT7444877.1 hypoxanthine-guanine phosphoribosyltransferase [Methylococcales bacterium]
MSEPVDYQKVFDESDLLHSEAEMHAALDRVAAEITKEHADSQPLLLAVMVGGVVMMGHLATRLSFPLEIDYVHATRYRGETSGGDLHWYGYPKTALAGRNVILIDDIFDEGYTMKALCEYCESENVNSVQSAVLVNKVHDRKVEYRPNYVGLDIADRYVFGFGMDYQNHWRNAPGIYAVKGL